MVVALPELVWIALLFFAFAVVWVLRSFIQAMFGTLIADIEKIPLAGSVVAGWLHTIEQAVSNALGTAEHAIDKAVGASFHLMARYMGWLWRALEQQAAAIYGLAEHVASSVYRDSGLKALVHTIAKSMHAVTAGVKTLTKEYHGIEHRVKVLEKDWAKGIGHDLRIQVKALDKELAHVENKVIPAIRGEVTTAEGEITNLYEWAKGKASLIGVGTFAFAVAAVIGSDIFKLLRCNEAGNLARKYRCGLWNLLGNLLGLAAFLTVAFDFQEFVDASEEVATFIGGAISEFEGAFPLSLPPLPPPN